jgi:hypothetical protein
MIMLWSVNDSCGGINVMLIQLLETIPYFETGFIPEFRRNEFSKPAFISSTALF